MFLLFIENWCCNNITTEIIGSQRPSSVSVWRLVNRGFHESAARLARLNHQTANRVAMDAGYDVGARAHQVFVAALQLWSAEIFGVEIVALQHGPHRAIQHKDALGEQFFKNFRINGHGTFLLKQQPPTPHPAPIGNGQKAR